MIPCSPLLHALLVVFRTQDASTLPQTPPRVISLQPPALLLVSHTTLPAALYDMISLAVRWLQETMALASLTAALNAQFVDGSH
mmetsp:Transcript_57779/g.94891  ORF Transcript_57779/g.94891 Transcript_57779/m.94891 type:complete len:84 (+) Transcript_57779:556-807(+)